MRSRVSAGRASTTAFRAMAPPSSLIANRVSMLSSPSIEKRRALPDAPPSSPFEIQSRAQPSSRPLVQRHARTSFGIVRPAVALGALIVGELLILRVAVHAGHRGTVDGSVGIREPIVGRGLGQSLKGASVAGQALLVGHIGASPVAGFGHLGSRITRLVAGGFGSAAGAQAARPCTAPRCRPIGSA